MRPSLGALAVLLVSAACMDALEPGASASRALAPRSDSPSGVGPRSMDAEWASLARGPGGFAGWYLDEGVPVIAFTDTLQAKLKQDEAIARVRTDAGALELGNAGKTSWRLVQVPYSFAQLSAWHSVADSIGPQLGGIVTTDADERQNRLVVGVRDTSRSRDLAAAFIRAGIPKGVLEFVQAEAVELSARRYSFNFAIIDTVRPVVGGIQTATTYDAPGYLGCTLSFNVNYGGPAFLTNSHCTGEYGSLLHLTEFTQPFYSSESLGTEVADTAVYWPTSDCPFGWVCRWSDSAILRYNSGVQWALGYLARTTASGYPQNVQGSLILHATNPRFEVVQKDYTLVQGMPFYRMGRTSGWTYHTIFSTCFTFMGTIPNRSGGNRAVKLWCQYTASGQSLPGDSGGPMFRVVDCAPGSPTRPDGTPCVRLLGVNWGNQTPPNPGRAVFSPISGVENDFGVALLVRPSDWP